MGVLMLVVGIVFFNYRVVIYSVHCSKAKKIAKQKAIAAQRRAKAIQRQAQEYKHPTNPNIPNNVTRIYPQKYTPPQPPNSPPKTTRDRDTSNGYKKGQTKR